MTCTSSLFKVNTFSRFFFCFFNFLFSFCILIRKSFQIERFFFWGMDGIRIYRSQSYDTTVEVVIQKKFSDLRHTFVFRGSFWQRSKTPKCQWKVRRWVRLQLRLQLQRCLEWCSRKGTSIRWCRWRSWLGIRVGQWLRQRNLRCCQCSRNPELFL